jgi:hypothetical protein
MTMKSGKQKIKKDVGHDDGQWSTNGPCPSDGGSVDCGQRNKLRLNKEQCTLLEDNFR